MSINAISGVNAVNSMLESKKSQIRSPKGMFQDILSEKLGTSQDSSSLATVNSQTQPENLSYSDLASYYGMDSQGWNGLVQNGNASSYAAMIAANAATNGSSSKTTQYDQYIKEAAKEYDVPENLIKAVIQCESSFNANAVSKSGAVGLMQLMPATAKSLGVTNSYDPRQNIMGGTKYLSSLVKNFDGDLLLAMSGYNMGGNRVKKLGITPNSTNESAYSSIPKGVLAYAKKVVETMGKYGG